jgi:flagellin
MDITFVLGGRLGSATLKYNADGSNDILGEINAATSRTGVMASAVASGLLFKTVQTGTDEFVSIQTLYCSDPDEVINVYAQNGSDARVSVNGERAGVDGNRVSFNTSSVSGSFTLTSTGDRDGATSAITVDGGGATFQLGADPTTRLTIGLAAMFSHNLGKTGTGFISELKSGGTQELLGMGTKQLAIVKEAINAVAEARGHIGGVQKYQVQTSISSLQATAKSLADAMTVIDDVDYAQETAELNRQNVLMQSSLSLLGLANQQSSQVLSLLGG